MKFRRKRIDVRSLPRPFTEKWPGKTLDQGFVPFPKRLLRCASDLFRGPNALAELRVILAIIDYRRPDLTRNPSLEFLAFTAGMPDDEFREHLSGLAEQGLISIGDDEDEYELEIEIDGLLDEIEKRTSDEE